MEITIRTVGEDVTVVQPSGRLTISEGTKEFRKAIAEQIDSGARKILLDLSSVRFIDSTGIGAIVASYSEAAKGGGEVRLLGLDPRLDRFLTVLKRYQDEEEAVKSFS